MFSIAFGFKMSAALYLPGLYFIASRSEGIFIGTLYMIFIISFQLLIALPFLEVSTTGYLKNSFDTTRGFLLQHSYTFRFLPTEFGDNFWFKTFCLTTHLSSLLFFLFFKWTSLRRVFREISLWPLKFLPDFKELEPRFIAEVFFICNYTGVLWSRGIHFQFVIWFLFSVPFMIEIGQPSLHMWKARHLLGVFTLFEFLLSVRPDYTVPTWTGVHVFMLVVFFRMWLTVWYKEQGNYDELKNEMISHEFEFKQIGNK